jgi:hypothetical protein
MCPDDFSGIIPVPQERKPPLVISIAAIKYGHFSTSRVDLDTYLW